MSLHQLEGQRYEPGKIIANKKKKKERKVSIVKEKKILDICKQYLSSIEFPNLTKLHG